MIPTWDDDPVVASWSGLPRLDGDIEADACIVGLGGSGLTAVHALKDRGLDVVGLDAGRVAHGAAGRNGGFLIGGPATFLHTAIDSWGSSAADLYRETLRELDRLERLLGSDVVRRTGSIRLAGLPGAHDEEDLHDCHALSATLSEHGIDVDAYDGELGRGIFLPDDAVTNPARSAIGLASMLTTDARLFEYSPAIAIRSGSVSTASGSVTAPIVVVAVDGRLDHVLPQLSGRVATARLQMLATRPAPPRRLPCPVYGRWGYDYAQQSTDGRLYVGGGRDKFFDDEWTASTDPTDQVQHHIEAVAAAMAGRPVEVIGRWAASVGFTEDGRALCTEVDDCVIAIGGYNGTGNLVGRVAARAAVGRLLDGTTIPDYLSS